MIRPEPFAIHHLSSGWTIREHHAQRERAFVETPANGRDSELARFVARYNRRHHCKTLTVIHLLGTTTEEQGRTLKCALKWASRPHRFPLQGFWRRHRDRFYPGNYYYTVIVGDAVDEVSAFERLRRGLHTDDAIDLEFQSIVHQMGDMGVAPLDS